MVLRVRRPLSLMQCKKDATPFSFSCVSHVNFNSFIFCIKSLIYKITMYSKMLNAKLAL